MDAGIEYLTMFTCYEPRQCAFLGMRKARGFRLKTYSIVQRNFPFERDRFESGMNLVSAKLPQPPVTASRPGFGFVIFHQGAMGDYIVLSWWDNENELPTRVFVRDQNNWRPARANESFCVWDLRIIWHEREAYVKTILAGAGVDQYLEAVMEGWV